MCETCHRVAQDVYLTLEGHEAKLKITSGKAYRGRGTSRAPCEDTQINRSDSVMPGGLPNIAQGK